MAQRQANRFALLSVLHAESEPRISASSLTGAIRDSLFSHWGEFHLATATLKVVFLDYLDKSNALAILRFPRNFTGQVLSSCALLLECNETTLALRVLRISGRLRNSAEAGVDAVRLLQSFSHPQRESPVVAKLLDLPEYA